MPRCCTNGDLRTRGRGLLFFCFVFFSCEFLWCFWGRFHTLTLFLWFGVCDAASCVTSMLLRTQRQRRGSRFLEVISAELSHAIKTSHLLLLFRTVSERSRRVHRRFIHEPAFMICAVQVEKHLLNLLFRYQD